MKAKAGSCRLSLLTAYRARPAHLKVLLDGLARARDLGETGQDGPGPDLRGRPACAGAPRAPAGSPAFRSLPLLPGGAVPRRRWISRGLRGVGSRGSGSHRAHVRLGALPGPVLRSPVFAHAPSP